MVILVDVFCAFGLTVDPTCLSAAPIALITTEQQYQKTIFIHLGGVISESLDDR